MSGDVDLGTTGRDVRAWRRGDAAEPRFELGRVVITAAAHAELGPHGDVDDLVSRLLDRHVAGDWGDLDDEDKQANERALVHGSRILSRYDRAVGDVDLYVITDGVSDVCPACWAGIGECEPDKGSRHGGTHFRDDLPPRRLATTVLRPDDY